MIITKNIYSLIKRFYQKPEKHLWLNFLPSLKTHSNFVDKTSGSEINREYNYINAWFL